MKIDLPNVKHDISNLRVVNPDEEDHCTGCKFYIDDGCHTGLMCYTVDRHGRLIEWVYV